MSAAAVSHEEILGKVLDLEDEAVTIRDDVAELKGEVAEIREEIGKAGTRISGAIALVVPLVEIAKYLIVGG